MDRISSLPNELLCHILSFLTTKEAALTSVLSKRWLNLIAFVPYLDIDDSLFLHPEEGKRDRPEIIQSFIDFVDKILALQDDSPIKKVKLSYKCLNQLDSNRVDGWVSNVLARGVLDLDLEIILDLEDEDYQRYRLCPNSFKSSTLVSLKLEFGIKIGWSAESIFLPVLKTLVIDSAEVHNFEILLQALPVLEELVLVDVLWENWDVNISSASLTTLTMKTSDMSTLSIDTPNLVCFTYYDDVVSDYPVVNMKNLLDARIDFSLTEKEVQLAREPNENDVNQFPEIFIGFSNVWKLFHGIQDVVYLYLSPDALEVLSLCSESMPVYKNLKSLAIKSDKNRGWQAMPVLLRNCPHLETLVLEGLLHYTTDKCWDACDCISREVKGHSLASSQVKVLEIQGFRGTLKEMTLIKHFLDYFPSLKEMEIYIEENDPTDLRVPEVGNLISQMFEEYNKFSSCNVRLLVSDYLYNKWIAKKRDLS